MPARQMRAAMGVRMACSRARWMRDVHRPQGRLGLGQSGQSNEQRTFAENHLADALPPRPSLQCHAFHRDGEKHCAASCSAASTRWEDIRTATCTAPTGRALMPWRWRGRPPLTRLDPARPTVPLAPASSTSLRGDRASAAPAEGLLRLTAPLLNETESSSGYTHQSSHALCTCTCA